MMSIWSPTPTEQILLGSVLHSISIDFKDIGQVFREVEQGQSFKYFDSFICNPRSFHQSQPIGHSFDSRFMMQESFTTRNLFTVQESDRFKSDFNDQRVRKVAKNVKCALCISSGEEYIDHALKDERGKVVCPILFSFTCKICGATGEEAHTIKFCPLNPYTNGDPIGQRLPAGLPWCLISKSIKRQ